MKCHQFAHPASHLLGTKWKVGISTACGWSHLAGQTTLDTTVSHSVHWGHRLRLHQQGAWQSSTGQGHSCLHFATSWHWWPHQRQAMCPVGNKCMVMGNCDTVVYKTWPDWYCVSRKMHTIQQGTMTTVKSNPARHHHVCPVKGIQRFYITVGCLSFI